MGFGAGLAPRAPGTAGTLPGVVFCLLLSSLPLSIYLLSVVLIALIGIWICNTASRELGVHDHGGIVWDEIAGYLVTMIAIPIGVSTLVAGFILFRLFDIWKPWPVNWLDKHVDGGLGIMADDIVAGVYACLVLHGLVALYPGLFTN